MSERVLGDTSAWVAFFRGQQPTCARVMELIESVRALPDLLRELRERGPVIPSKDGHIAALALRHDAAPLTLDGHFDGIEGLRLDAPPT